MALDTRHPAYIQRAPDWEVMADTHAGERRVKERGTVYLPATSGMVAAGFSGGSGLFTEPDERGHVEIASAIIAENPGAAQYRAYLARAVFHELVQASAEALVGIMHAKPPTILLPDVLEPLREDATQDRESLATLLRRVNEEQLLKGRIGLLLDVRGEQGPTALPYLSTYAAEAILNWGVDRVAEPGRLLFAVLNETAQELQPDLSWEEQTRYLVLGDVRFAAVRGLAEDAGALPPAGPDRGYVAATATDADAEALPFAEVQIAGRGLPEIPFVTIGAKDLQWDPDQPPLLRVARMALAIYRGEADYRHALHMQGQDTLVTIGAKQDTGYAAAGEAVKGRPLLLGANGRIDLDIGGDAKFIGVSAAGLAAQKEAIENDKRAAAEMGAQILDRGKAAESGDALDIRVAARTATLTTVALAGAQGLERILKLAAVLKGANPDEVKVTPNLDFGGAALTAQDLLYAMQAKSMGAPWSIRSIHDWMRTNDLTTRSFEEEEGEIGEEGPTPGSALGGAGHGMGADGGVDVTDQDLADLFAPELLRSEPKAT